MAMGMDGDERVLATAQHIVRSLGTSHNMTQDMLSILCNFDHRFSAMTDRLDTQMLEVAEELVLRWESTSCDAAMIWDGPPEEAEAYLQAVDDIHHLMETLHVTDSSTNDTLERAQSVHQMAMARLHEEFRHALVQNSEYFEPDQLYRTISGPVSRVSFRSRRAEEEEEEPRSSGEEKSHKDEGTFKDSVFLIDLVRPKVIPDLRDIAQRLIAGKYQRECCQAYWSVRKEVLDENLYRLGVEKLSIEEIQKTGWELLEAKIKKWIQAIKITVRVLFASEKDLCSAIFQGVSSAQETCFTEICKGHMMQFLNFSEAVAISRRAPEKLFRILDIYETLSGLATDVDCIFSEESCESIRVETSGILVRLAEAARGTFAEFENAIQRETSRTPIPGGTIHPLTRYVMNYIRFLFDYTDTLKLLIVNTREEKNTRKLSDKGGDNLKYFSDDDEKGESKDLSPLAQQLLSIAELLKSNLDGKSKLYKDTALPHLFLMNNIHYIVQKVKGSELGGFLGDDWVRKHSGQVRQCAMNYQRAAWNKVLACLKDEGIYFSGGVSSGVSKAALKERFKKFNAAFEQVHRTQTTWIVPDPQLREELKISIAEKLLPAYRSFMGRFRSHLESGRHAERYIKYTPEDLENYLMDLFEGLPGSMHHQRRRSPS